MSAPTTFQKLLDDEVLDIGDGYRAKNSELTGGGEIFLRAGHVTDTHIDFEGVGRFDPALSEKVESKMSKVGDTIITTKGDSTGRTSFVTPDMPPFVYSPHLCYWRSTDPETIENGFLRYWARGKEFQHQLAALKASTDMAPYLSLKDQKRLKISLPPIEEQRAIASILGALDDKIELNRRMNATLESLARAIFKSWFVDFDPVHVNAGLALTGQMPVSSATETTHDPKVLELFPSTFQDSELGPIPEGWKVVEIASIAKVSSGKRPPEKNKEPTESLQVPVFGGGGLMAYTSEPLNDDKYILTGRVGTLGEFYRITEPIWPSDNTLLLTVHNQFDFDFTYFHLLRLDVGSLNRGSTQPLLTQGDLKKQQIVLPPEKVRRAFNGYASPLFDEISRSLCGSQSLARLRDVLLPQLLSGELPVPEALTQAEEVPA